ncbi:MAG: ATP synthase F1 subunit gamma [bacterium]
MGNVREILRRVNGITGTRKVTNVMKMISATRLYKAEQKVMRGRPYLLALEELMAELLPQIEEENIPLMQRREGNKVLYVVFSSDRGLCGSFNSMLMRLLESRLKVAFGQSIELVVVGKKALVHLSSKGHKIVRSYANLAKDPNVNLSELITQDLIDIYERGDADKIQIAYNRYISKQTFEPMISSFLPLDFAEICLEIQGMQKVCSLFTSIGTAAGRYGSEFIYEPEKEKIFNYILPLFLKGFIHQVILELYAGEHAARLNAMNQATKNADDLVHGLTLEYYRERQKQITTELVEVVSGAEALGA